MVGPVLTAAPFGFIANREAVTLYNKLGAQVGTTITDGKRLPQGNSERAPSKGEYLATEVDWRLPAAQVGGAIQPGWNIIDANSIPYTVIDVDPPGTYSAAWRCSCRKVDVLGLINQVDWRIVNQETDDFADRITDPNTFELGGHYPARIQPASAEVLDLLGKRGLVNHYAIYVLPDLDLTFGDLLIDTQSTNQQQYKVVAWRHKQELAEALTILAEIQP